MPHDEASDFEQGRRDVPQYATPEELLYMEERDHAGLMRRFKRARDHVHETGRLHASDLQLPIYASPRYAKESLPGYQGGVFDPEKLGVAYVVVPPSDCRGVILSGGTWNLNPVSSLPPPSRCGGACPQTCKPLLPRQPSQPSVHAVQHLAPCLSFSTRPRTPSFLPDRKSASSISIC